MLTKLSEEQRLETPERFLGVLDILTLEFELDALDLFRERFLAHSIGLEQSKPSSP